MMRDQFILVAYAALLVGGVIQSAVLLLVLRVLFKVVNLLQKIEQK